MEADLQRILSVGEECISEKELRALILAKGRGVDDDGETSLGWGLCCIVVLPSHDAGWCLLDHIDLLLGSYFEPDEKYDTIDPSRGNMHESVSTEIHQF